MKFRRLEAQEIECRVQTVKEKGLQLLLYKDARADMNLLDETVGSENWQRNHELINGNLFCNVGIRIDGEWVWKQDVGTESATEAEKGQASDAFKRACTNWGLGRELYTSPFIWITDAEITPKGSGFTCYDRFSVKSIGYDSKGNINSLVIENSKTHKVVYSYGKQAVKETPMPTEELKDNTINLTQLKDEELRAMFLKYINDNEYSDDQKQKICACYNVKNLTDMPGNYCLHYLTELQKKGKIK